MAKPKKTLKLLIVENDEKFLHFLQTFFEEAGYSVITESSGEKALHLVHRVDCMVTDVHLSSMDGLELLEKARKINPALQVIVMTGYGTVHDAVKAMQLGVWTYLTKPFPPEQLLNYIEEFEEIKSLRCMASLGGIGGLVGISPIMQHIYSEIEIAASSDFPVLLTGETGTGKNVVAQAIHSFSLRKNQPFISVDLGVIPPDLVESELFGFERGAFTGADKKKKGRFSEALGGTILLDELETLPYTLQPRLLRVIEQKEIWPVGAKTPHHIDVRFIAASNADIGRLVTEEKFRQDLFYRLNVITITMPPLRDRPEDIPVITRVLLDRFQEKLKRQQSSGEDNSQHLPIEISAEALSCLTTRSWDGNVRELGHVLEQALLQASLSAHQNIRIDIEHLNPDLAYFRELSFKEAKSLMANEWSKMTIESALIASEGNVSKAARMLQLDRNVLTQMRKKLKIEPQ